MDFGDLDAAIAQLTGPSQGSLESAPSLMSSLSELQLMASSTLEFRDEEDIEAAQESDEEEEIPEEVG
jgi:hypothetical protein